MKKGNIPSKIVKRSHKWDTQRENSENTWESGQKEQNFKLLSCFAFQESPLNPSTCNKVDLHFRRYFRNRLLKKKKKITRVQKSISNWGNEGKLDYNNINYKN